MNPDKPKVSIVIPVYNGSNYLKEAIDSALAQTYENVEVIVVNDGSKDESATDKIAKSYGDRVKYYYKQNGGVATALNLGIKKMAGEYFSWLSHDDLYKPDKIERQIRFLNKHSLKNAVLACNVKTLFANGIKKKQYIDKRTFKFIDIFLATSAITGLNGCSLLIPRELLEGSGGFDPTLPLTQDYDLWFRLMKKSKFVLLDDHLVISRVHAEQDSLKKQTEMVKAADNLHSNFLRQIPYERFEEYFAADKKNIDHAIANYRVFKERGYKQTCVLLLKNILDYYRTHDTHKFKTLSEAETGNNHLQVKESKSIPKSLVGRTINSVKRDGVMLTVEKIARKITYR